MGHKKKRGGGSGGRRNKARTPSKDHTSPFSHDDYNEQLSEEITALCSIFQEDCEFVPGSPPQVVIKLRPYSNDMGYEDVDVSAVLIVRYVNSLI
jgi:translation initiation factor 2-alpha kinase 4